MAYQTVTGKITVDPIKVRFTASGKAVMNFYVADNLDLNKIHHVVAWEAKAEEIEKSYDVGDMVEITGYFKTKTYWKGEQTYQELTIVYIKKVKQ